MKYTIYIALLSISIYAQNFDKKFLTKFETSNYFETARYDESIQYFKNLAEASPYAKLISFGKSPQGRDMWVLVVSKDQAFTPDDARKTGKPVMMINNGIHSGEIEGKDASMILLREILITKEKEKYLDNAILLVIPIFSVDAHERFRAYNRINQNGPTEMGWRVTSQNFNLNRDWMKADALEMRNMLRLYNEWLPEFFIDDHTTDGADYQYTVTYGVEKYTNLEVGLRNLVKQKFIPFWENKVVEQGFLVAPYVYLKNDSLEQGISEWASGPRLSTGYMALQNRISLLIETHMIKPYKDRVFGTKAGIEAAIQFVNNNADELVKLSRQADVNSIKEYTSGKYLPIAFINDGKTKNIFNWKGIKFKKEFSEISGREKIVYTGEKFEQEIPYYNEVMITDSVLPAKGYLIPEQFKEIVDIIKLHGINVEQLKEDKEFNVQKIKFFNPKFSQFSNESRQRIDFGYATESIKYNAPAGTYYVAVNQRTIRVIVNLLEPKASDSFVKWGFFNNFFEQKEYFEDYVMEKEALKMIEKNPELKVEFEKKLNEDEAFRKNPYARLNFFYERSPYYDEQYMVYPIMKVE
ncbi:MAG TPA: M14 family metallopeptidase [Ignavibacteriaceae bacterium]|nr:M14 family metallopeptidase [Ignavibacteriaceae bacterium]